MSLPYNKFTDLAPST